MPVSIVVGGQFGSEGKGKTALEIVRRSHEAVVVARVGGPNVEHTSYDRSGTRHTLRQLPASCVDGNVDVVFPAGSYIDVDLLAAEMKTLNLWDLYPMVDKRHHVVVSGVLDTLHVDHVNHWI